VSINSASLQNPILAAARRSQYPSFDWNIYPQMHEQLFDPNNRWGFSWSALSPPESNFRRGCC